ncbi:MAG: radical SAM protein [Candidatus Gastranaerophilales bacterium]|nr:radical SAM protein [Candidatus Gastranaerophilales bacterium]
MKYKCCNHILGSIDLSFSGFKYCNEVWEGPEYIHYSEENAFEKNEERRLKIIEEMKNGIIPIKCQQCPMLEEKEWKEFDGKIFKITVFNWAHCNASCFYCSVHSNFCETVKKSDEYDALPIIEKLSDEGRLTSDTFIAFMGGEPTMLEEFPQILKMLLDKNCRIEVLSNGIKYEPEISRMLQAENNNNICISLDCGCRESYKKIKRVDKYNEVLQTVKRYIDEAGDKSNRLRLKYIIFPNVNDNKKEIDNFFKVCQNLKVKTVSRAVNHQESKMNTTNKVIESSVIKSYEYFAKQAEKFGMTLMPEMWADAIVENKVYNCRQISLLTRIKATLKFLSGKNIK